MPNKQYKTVADRLLVNLKRLTRQPFHIAIRYGQLNEKQRFQLQDKFCRLRDIFQPTEENEYKAPNH